MEQWSKQQLSFAVKAFIKVVAIKLLSVFSGLIFIFSLSYNLLLGIHVKFTIFIAHQRMYYVIDQRLLLGKQL